MSIELLQKDADFLLSLEKHRASDEKYDYPGPGSQLRIPLLSADRRESFSLDILRSQLILEKGNYQNRAKTAIILARLDFSGPGHRNPDGEEISGLHLHTYREGYGDKWAFELPKEHFSGNTNPWDLLQEFMRFVRIITPPKLEKSIFL